MSESLIARLHRIAIERPKKIALITDANRVTYEALLRIISIFDSKLTAHGVRHGDTIVIASTWAEILIPMYFLASLRGLSVIMTSPAVAAANGLKYDAIVAAENTPEAAIPNAIIARSIWFAEVSKVRTPDYSRAKGGGSFIVRTSGSTGNPALVQTDEADRMDEVLNDGRFTEEERSFQRLYITLGIGTNHAAGQSLATLLCGGSLISMADGHPQGLAFLDQYRPDVLVTTVFGLQKLLKHPNLAQYLTSVRDVLVAASETGPSTVQEFAKVTRARMWVGYGSVETGHITHGHFNRNSPLPAACVGAIWSDDIEVGFFNDDYKRMPDATEGIVGFRRKSGPIKRRLIGDTARSHGARRTEDGFICTGDIMRRDGDVLFLIGRVKNTVNLGGNKHSLEAIESALQEVFRGQPIVAVARKNAKGIEELAVVVEEGSPIPLEQANKVLKSKFRSVSIAELVMVPKIPSNHMGKYDRELLKTLIPKVTSA
jgi:acyl-coenzyme A synthetase/AMP-(fatty) acid ligase